METTVMKNFLQDGVDWLAQRLITLALPRAAEMIDEAMAPKKGNAPKALPAPSLPQIELH